MSLSITSSRSIALQHVSGCPYLLGLNSTALSTQTTSCSSARLLKDSWAGCFHILAVVKNAAVTWLCKCVFETQLSDLVCVSPEVGLLDHIVILSLTFCGTAVLFSAATPFYSPTSEPQASSCSASSPTLVPDTCHPGGREVASHCGFHLCFLMTSDAEHLMCLLAIPGSLEKWPFESFAQF